MKIHQLTVAEALASVRSSSGGLSADEAARRLNEFGPNEVEVIQREPLLRRFLRSITHFFALVLWLAAVLAFVVEARDPGQGMFALGCAIVGVILINGAFSFWQEYRAERALDALRRLLPPQVRVLRDGATVIAPACKLVPGDVVFLEAGDRVSADCRVLEAFGLRVNTATVSGESVPHSREAGVSEETDFLHSRNVLLAGTSLVAGEATALVFATGAHTMFGQIARLTQSAGDRLSPLQREIVRLSRVVGLLAAGLGVLFFIIGRSLGLPFWSNFIFAIGIIVANVPEGLLPTLTLALAMGSQRMARRNALIRHLPAVETLGAATVICTDKTGTLTENRLKAKRLWVGGEESPLADHVRAHSVFVRYPRLVEVARLSHNLKPGPPGGPTRWVGDPLEIALAEFADELASPPSGGNPRRLDEIPFDSGRRRMSTLHEHADGRVLLMKGAPEAVLPLCERLELSDGCRELDGNWVPRIRDANQTLAQQGMRVLALAWRLVPEGVERDEWETDLTFVGLIAFEDPTRAEVPVAVERCRDAGIRVIMVTGDHPDTALAVARQIGLVRSSHPTVITGTELQHLSNTQLQLALGAPEVHFARVAADQKLRIVAALKCKGEIVAVTGDGVNDAPALKRADIGIAMGRCGTDVAREAADIVLLDDNFATIVAAVEEGRAVYANIRKFLTYILTSNVPELVPYLAYVTLQIPLPLTILQILAVDLGTDMVPALALGAEPPHPNTMKRPPRPRGERLLSLSLLVRAYLWLGLLQAGGALAAFFFVLNRGNWRYGEALAADSPLYRQATTACLSAIISMQVINVFNCRSRRESVLRFNLSSNPLLLVGLLVEVTLILIIDYTPWGNAVFGTAPIPLTVWGFMLPFALGLLLLEEARKWIQRRRGGEV